MKKSLLLAISIASQTAIATEMQEVAIDGRNINLIGQAVSASEGVVGQKEIALRPLLRTGEVLELVPGMVVTQHSGTGKANQYFLRGFNLDHGTDFSNFVDGMPVNMRSHGHGQGYTDLNFLIPEAVTKISYNKGAYNANVGDFSGAGSAHIETVSTVEKGLVSGTFGEDDYYRLLVMDSFEMAGGNIFYAIEGNRYEGPWTDIDEDLDKINLLLKHSLHIGEGHLQVGLMAYDNSWNSADQIPELAVQNGFIDERGSIDDTVGGESSRYSLNVDWRLGGLHASAYLIDYELNLWSNFTYFLEDPVNGDQFEQVDDRKIYGGQANYLANGELSGNDMSNRIGVDFRKDDIDEVGLYQTTARQRACGTCGVTRSDEITETSVGVYWENRIAWSDSVRTVFGARYDYFDFDVNDKAGVNLNAIDFSVNSGSTDDDLISLKGSVIWAMSEGLETYMSAGQGYHSNDARGTVISVDPADGSPVDKVDPLVSSLGYEAGIRVFDENKLNASLAVWVLELDSELLFVGDAGNTETSGKSKRQGVEATVYYRIDNQLSLDLEYAYTDSRLVDEDPDYISGALEHVVQAGVSAELENGLFGSLRVRYFGERPLDDSFESDSSTVWNLRSGYRYEDWTFRVDVLNLTDSDDHDITYAYESQYVSGDAATQVTGIHYHVIEPRTVRLTVEKQF